jgi:alanyl-tRNA synthetase
MASAAISAWKRDELRSRLDAIKKVLTDLDKKRREELSKLLIEEAKRVAQECKDAGNNYVVHKFSFDCSDARVLNQAIKEMNKIHEGLAVMAITVDATAEGSVLCIAQVPKDKVSLGLKANEWIDHINSVLEGRGGGKELAAQVKGSRVDKVTDVHDMAQVFANLKLNNI